MAFFKQLISNFLFVKVTDNEPDEDTDEEVRENILPAVQELREIEAGKRKARPAKDFLKNCEISSPNCW